MINKKEYFYLLADKQDFLEIIYDTNHTYSVNFYIIV